MKLQHLAVGARFEYEGVVYVKTGPLTASSEVGGQRIIPRHATLRPIENAAVDMGTDGKKRVDKIQVIQAFDTFYAHCETLVGDAGRASLAEARARFLADL